MCNRDCFNCIYDDCILDEIDENDLQELKDAEEIAGIIKPSKKSGYNKEQKAAYYNAHREKYKSYRRKHYEKHREQIKAYQKRYYQEHKKEVLEKKKQKRKLNKLNLLSSALPLI